MLNVLPSAVTETKSDWVVRLGIQLMGDRREAIADEDLERMLELTAPRGEVAMDRARALVAWCARYAGLSAIEVAARAGGARTSSCPAPADLSV